MVKIVKIYNDGCTQVKLELTKPVSSELVYGLYDSTKQIDVFENNCKRSRSGKLYRHYDYITYLNRSWRIWNLPIDRSVDTVMH